jgi:regulator of replication initiation timing
MTWFGFLKRKNKCDICPIKKAVENAELTETAISTYLMQRMDTLIESTHKLEQSYINLLEENAKLIKENKHLKGKVKVEFT